MTHPREALALSLLLPLLLAGVRLTARDSITVWEGVYSGAQADRGSNEYTKCAACHGPNLEGQGAAGALRGSTFLMKWEGRTLEDLVARILTTMPQDDPGSLSEQAAVDIVAFILRANGFPSSDSELPTLAEALKAIDIVSKKP